MNKSDLGVCAITAFVPARDYALSRSFYQELGFAEEYSSGSMTRFQVMGVGFWLQDYYVEEWANNTMLCLYVKDIRDWWQRVNNVKSSERFAEHMKIYGEPVEQDEGMIFQMSDPAGVLWHIRQNL